MHIYVQDEVHTVCIGRRKDKGKGEEQLIVPIANGKGGMGKTTVAVALTLSADDECSIDRLRC